MPAPQRHKNCFDCVVAEAWHCVLMHGEKMSFTQMVKKEILSNIKKMKGCCATSFLTAVLKSIGSICVNAQGCGFSVETDNCDLLMLCSQLAQTEFDAETVVYQTASNDKSAKFCGIFDVSLGEKLHLVRYDDDGSLLIFEDTNLNLEKGCCRRAFMQALFLACGSTTIPYDETQQNVLLESKHANYHLELRISNAEFAEFVLKNFSEIGFKNTARKSHTVLYLKDSNKIADFFVFVDAINAKFQVENIIIGRSFRNTANRQKNCIDSNITKAVAAATKHLAAIAKIRESGRFEQLPIPLQEMATAREEYPEANLAELAELLKISKSGVNHRLAKLLEIAENL